jgi:hypothetical protein
MAGAFPPFGFLDDLTTPSDLGFLAALLLLAPDLFAACLFFTVRVLDGAIVGEGDSCFLGSLVMLQGELKKKKKL